MCIYCRWQSASGGVVKARGRIRVVDDCHLMINAVDTNDAGNYTCYVSNVAATKSVGITLTVAGALAPWRLVTVNQAL